MRRKGIFVAGLALSLFAGPAMAADPSAPCKAVSITMDVGLDARWQAAGRELRAHLARLGQIDRCTRVRVVSTEQGIQVHVDTTDGRSAVRPIAEPAALADTVDALLLLPSAFAEDLDPSRKEAPPVSSAPAIAIAIAPTAPPAPEKAADAAPAAPPPIEVPSKKQGAERAKPSPVVPAASPFGFGLGVGALGLTNPSGGTIGGGGEAWAYLRWTSLWAGFRGAGASQTPVLGTAMSGYHMESAALSLSVGRRFPLGSWAIDAGLGGGATIDTQGGTRTVTVDDNGGGGGGGGDDPPETEPENDDSSGSSGSTTTEPIGGTSVAPKVDATVRVMFPTLAWLRPYSTVSASAWPGRIARAEQIAPELPFLPTWEITLSLGLAWEPR